MTDMDDLLESQDFTELTPETIETTFNNARALRIGYFNSAQDHNTTGAVTVRYHSVQDLRTLITITTASQRFRPMTQADVKPYEVYLSVDCETDDFNNRFLRFALGRFKPRKQGPGLLNTFGFVTTPQQIARQNEEIIKQPEQLENNYGKTGHTLILTVPPTVNTRDVIGLLEKAKNEQESYHILGVQKARQPLTLPFESLRDIYTICHGITQSKHRPLSQNEITDGKGYIHLLAQLLELDRGELQVTRGRLTTHEGRLYDHTGQLMPEDIRMRILTVAKDNTKLLGTPLYLHCFT